VTVADGIYCEPRALWEVFSVQSNGQLANRVRGDIDRWRNDSRHTYKLTHLLLAPVGYVFSELDTTPVDLASFRACGSVSQLCSIKLSAPQRVPYSRIQIPFNGFGWLPTEEPSLRGTAQSYASGLFGLSRWAFDFDFWLPNPGTVQFDLSTWVVPGIAPAVAGESVRHSILFDEIPDTDTASPRLRGHGRVRERRPLLAADVSGAFDPLLVWPRGSAPLPFDVFGSQSIGAVSPEVFPAENSFNKLLFKQQEWSQGTTHSRVRGMSVAIDQISFDDLLQTAGPPFPGQPVTPLSLRVACGARTINGGTGAEWWTYGCPLALVSPTIGPAQVHRLVEPIELAPSDSLEVVIEVPPPTLVGQTLLAPRYNIGASLIGYAEVRG
jgi:hypothetical protein